MREHSNSTSFVITVIIFSSVWNEDYIGFTVAVNDFSTRFSAKVFKWNVFFEIILRLVGALRR